MKNTNQDKIDFTARPHEDMYNEWFYGYFNLPKDQRAQERLADSEIYQKHLMAKKYGIQLYNMFGANNESNTQIQKQQTPRSTKKNSTKLWL